MLSDSQSLCDGVGFINRSIPLAIRRVASGSGSVLIGVRCIFIGLQADLLAIAGVSIGIPPTGAE